jgi:putative heme-binding domain-containing protein
MIAAMRTWAGIFVLLFLMMAPPRATGAEAGGRVRVPWTTSHVTGSPDPPMPYRLERAYPKLKLENLVDLVLMPGSNRWVAVTQYGMLYSFRADDVDCQKPEVFADLKKDLRGLDKVPGCRGVKESYAIAFHPKFPENRTCYVCIILDVPERTPGAQRASRISRFTVTDTNPPRIDPASEQVLVEWLGGGHNGCSLHFGRDGYLYISTGDAANPSPPDSFDTGQDISDLLGSILRIDVDHPSPGKTYSSPPDHPFVNTPGARPEVWAYGLRNPWRMGFDRQTGDLWVADVGWELWEMVYRVRGGGNYGWSVMEGPQSVRPSAKRGPTPILPPALSLNHSEAASITGGYVYRGKKLPKLYGQYVFGDWETRRVWASRVEPDGKLAPHARIADTDKRVVSFAEDKDGELYVMSYEEGMIFRIVPNDEAASKAGTFPHKLSETGLFVSVARNEPAPGVLPFAVNAAQWVDGGVAERFAAVPGSESLRWEDNRNVYPKDSVLVRTFSLPSGAGARQSRRVETQLLHFNGLRWNGYTYRWNDAETDADLVDAGGAEQKYTVPDPAAPGGKSEKVWRFPSRAQCVTCHNSFAEFALAFTVPQLNRACDARLGPASENQVHLLREVSVLPPPQRVRGDPTPPPPAPPLADPRDASADAGARARSYLHVNCSHCHRFGGGGSALIDLRYEIPLSETKAAGVRPNLGDFGIPGAQIIAPGDPARSVMLYRMAKLGRGRMPHIGSYEVDRDALLMMEHWIRQLPPSTSDAHSPTLVAAAEARAKEDNALQMLRSAKSVDAEISKSIDQLLSSPSGALALLLGVDAGRLPKDVRDEVVKRGADASLESVRDLYERFLPPERVAGRLGPSINPQTILALKGEAGRGRQVFFGSGDASSALCAQCHQVGGQGQSFGPDLSHIGTKYDRARLLENILEPSKTIDPQFVTHIARTAKGEDYVGILVRRDDNEVVLKDAQQKKEIRLRAAEVKRLVPQTSSAMPDGLLGALMPQQAADLIEFLSEQK